MQDSDSPAVPGSNGLRRFLVLDASGDAPEWLIASVTVGTDIRAAVMRNGRYTDWQEVTAWVREQVGQRVTTTPVSAVVWRILGEGQSQ